MSQNVLEDAEKYILAGHGSLLKGNYTIVPENVYIQYTIPRGNPFLLYGNHFSNTLLFYPDLLDEKKINSRLNLKINKIYYIFSSDDNKIYLILDNNFENKKYFEIKNNDWNEVAEPRDVMFYKKKEIFISKINKTTKEIEYFQRKENLNLMYYKNEFFNSDENIKIYKPGSVIQNQIIDFELNFPVDKNYKHSWLYSGLYKYSSLLNKSKENSKELLAVIKKDQDYIKSNINIDFINEFMQSIYQKNKDIILNKLLSLNLDKRFVDDILGFRNDYLELDKLIIKLKDGIYMSKLPNSYEKNKKEYLSLNENSLFKVKDKESSLSEIFKSLSLRATKENPIYLFIISCRSCSQDNINELVISSCNTNQIQEQQIDDQDFMAMRSFTDGLQNIGVVKRNLSSSLTFDQLQESYDNPIYLDLNELFYFKNENEIVDYMYKYNLFNLKLSKKAEKIELLGRNIFDSNVLKRSNLPKPGKIVTLKNLTNKKFNGKQVKISALKEWSKSSIGEDRIAVSLLDDKKKKPFLVKLENLEIKPEDTFTGLENIKQKFASFKDKFKTNPQIYNLKLNQIYNYFSFKILKNISEKIKEKYLINRKEYCALSDLILKNKINSKLIDFYYSYIIEANEKYFIFNQEYNPFINALNRKEIQLRERRERQLFKITHYQTRQLEETYQTRGGSNDQSGGFDF